ncbi:MAG: hypothetical protein AAGJ08_20335 [Cyanobacteria bacterium P01_H01_bin.35]
MSLKNRSTETSGWSKALAQPALEFPLTKKKRVCAYPWIGDKKENIPYVNPEGERQRC